MDQRIVQDMAERITHAVVGVFRNLLRPEEIKDAEEVVFDITKVGLELYETEVEQTRRRLNPLELKPSKN
jgi:hypothetical protein